VNQKNMGSLLSTLGLPGELLGQLVGPKHAAGNGNAGSTLTSSFGSVLNGQIGAPGASGPLAQLTALVQNGTPISTIIDRLANEVAGSVAQRQPQLGAMGKAKIVNLVKTALSPPSNAPPGGTAAQEVAALARRLQTWLAGMAGGGNQRVGQQSDTSGQVLDAKSARELPAQQDPASVSGQLDVSALAQSLLASVAASFGSAQTDRSNGSAATPLAASPAHAAVSAFSHAAKHATGQASTLARLQSAFASLAEEPSNSASSPLVSNSVTSDPPGTSSLPTAPQQTAQTAEQPQPVASNASDVLSRMIMRAADVDQRVNGAAIATALAARGAGRQTGRANTGGTSSPQSTPGVRLTAALSEAIASAAQSSSQDASSGDDLGSRNPASFATGPAVGSKAPSPVTGAAVFTLTNANPAGPAAPSSASLTGASVDAAMAVEQAMKSMAMRSQPDGGSEMRIHLSPAQLGSVTMRLTVSGSNVSATAVTQNADVRNALVAHQQQLARSLAESGLKLTSFTVNLSGGDAGNDRNRDRTSGFGRQYAVHEVAANGSPDEESSMEGPALVPASTLALFNYLA
jgi:flagellar hook-length control protein FliK